MNWQPLILAAAGAIVALTPVAVAYLTVQVRLLAQRADAIESAARADRLTTAAAVAAVGGLVKSNAQETQRVVRETGGATK